MVHSLLVEFTNYTCINNSLYLEGSKFITTYGHEISLCNLLSWLIHSHAPHLGGDTGGVHTDLATLFFKNGEHLEDFYNHIICLQQYIGLSSEKVSPAMILI